MKKLLMIVAIALFSVSITQAQTTPVKQTAKKVTKSVKTETKQAEKKTAKTAAKVKADGTPDMRYKANKAAKANPNGPKKKDGSADMRYKTNKAAAKKKN